MHAGKRNRLENAGFRIGSVQEFLGLSDAESRMVELRLALSNKLRQRREQRSLTQEALARELHSSQSRVAKMEACDPSVSVDLLIRGLLAVGATLEEIGETIAAGAA